MAWRLARSLETLRAEVNAFAPNRSKISDGTLGDPAHASRDSRHNPNRFGVVTALDLTHDPVGGFDAHAFARGHVKDPHPELAYVISNAQVAKRSTGFRWEPYTGLNKHEHHAHFGVGVGPDSDPLPPYDSLLPWGVSLALLPKPPAPPIALEETDMLIVKASGKATRLLAPPAFVPIGRETIESLGKAGVSTVTLTGAEYESLRAQIVRALDED